jgi:C-5 cytosine-specific DNA methylase
VADRIEKDRENALYVRTPDSTAKLWQIKASKIRSFTAREYARIQTFPDDWVFYGNNKRELQLQIGNAVPVNFAKRIAVKVRQALEVLDGHADNFIEIGEQMSIFSVVVWGGVLATGWGVMPSPPRLIKHHPFQTNNNPLPPPLYFLKAANYPASHQEISSYFQLPHKFSDVGLTSLYLPAIGKFELPSSWQKAGRGRRYRRVRYRLPDNGTHRFGLFRFKWQPA